MRRRDPPTEVKVSDGKERLEVHRTRRRDPLCDEHRRARHERVRHLAHAHGRARDDEERPARPQGRPHARARGVGALGGGARRVRRAQAEQLRELQRHCGGARVCSGSDGNSGSASVAVDVGRVSVAGRSVVGSRLSGADDARGTLSSRQ